MREIRTLRATWRGLETWSKAEHFRLAGAPVLDPTCESAGLQCPAPLTFVQAYDSVAEARRGIGAWLTFYNDERVHQALDYHTPREAYLGAVARGYDAAPAEQLGQRCALPTSPQAQQQQEKDSNYLKVGVGIGGASLVRDAEPATGGSLS